MEDFTACGQCKITDCKNNCPLNDVGEADQAPSPLDGMVRLPTSLTAENGAKALLIGEFSESDEITCPECLGSDESDGCEICGDKRTVTITLPVSWTTIKEIYAVIVKNLAT